MKKIFALVDCNNFYASCERVFNPTVMNRPVAVLSNNDGCVVARSDEVKALGVVLGTPYFKCQKQVRKHNIAIFSSNYTLYGDMSQRVMETLEQFTPDIEIYSIDEAFLSLSGFEHLNLYQYGRNIRRTVEKWTGIPVSIGIAATKTLAKIATRIAKKEKSSRGVCSLVNDSRLDDVLEAIPVEHIWGIGRRSAKKLHARGLYNAKQFKYANAKWVKKHLTVVGLRIQQELWETSCIPLEQFPPPKKQIICSRSFGRPVTSLHDLREAVSDYTHQAAMKLRKQKSLAEVLKVYIATNRFKAELQYCNAIHVTFPSATADSFQLARFACRCVERIFRSGYRYKKAGVVLAGLIPEGECQADLFWNTSSLRKQKLMDGLDVINEKYGHGSIQIASAGIHQPWQMKRGFMSPHYTTRWKDIPVVKATES
ncbi:MAG: Y-family DNA polymerase [Deltaproteobacteria bacterium]|jgi:DNA polymerase V